MAIWKLPGLGAAVVLAASTLAVFGRFQNYGPESAVRRFNQAVATGNGRELKSTLVEPSNSSAAVELAAVVRNVRAGGGRYNIVKMERSPDQVELLTVYENRKTIVWVVTKARDHWRIEALLTLQALRQLGYQ